MESEKNNSHQNIIKSWDSSNVYAFNKNAHRDEVYSIDTPPPTISGMLHMGHVFSYCHTDFIARFWRMSGKSVFYPIGFDNNGLPTERLVEKLHGVKASQMARSGQKKEFLDLYDQVVKNAESEFEALFKNLGLSFDWSLKYDTNSKKSNDIAKMSFTDLFQKNLAYLSHSPVYWDTTDQTALAQADIEDKDIQGHENNIRFTLHTGRFELGSGAMISSSPTGYAEIMTTRPELLPACICLLYNPLDQRYNGSAVGQEFEIERVDGTKVAVFGLDMNNHFAKTPFGLPVPIMADEDVKMEKGTGLVMCCTFGDWQDVEWMKKLNLEGRANTIISNHGRILNDCYETITEYEQVVKYTAKDAEFNKDNSRTVLEARKQCQHLLSDKCFILKGEQHKYLVATKDISHSVKCAERSGKPIEILNKPQWYIDFGFRQKKPAGMCFSFVNNANYKNTPHSDTNNLQTFQEHLLAMINRIRFHPIKMKKRLEQWIEGLNQDWCISRNRFAGVAIPKIKLYTNESRTKLFTFLHEDGYPPYEIFNQETSPGEQTTLLEGIIKKEAKEESLAFMSYITLSIAGENKKGAWLKQLHDSYKNTFDIKSFFSITQDSEDFVFDTWFTSSISPQLNTGTISHNEFIASAFGVNESAKELHQKIYPFNLRPQAHEIIRTWAFYTIVKSYLHNYSEDIQQEDFSSIIPWKDIALSGWCLARDKTKMSKSKGNVVDPLPLLEQYSPDSVRYWSSIGSLGTDTPFNEEALKHGNRLIKKLDNVVNFFKTNSSNIDPKTIIEDVKSDIINQTFDKWILSRLNQTVKEYNANFTEYEYSKARDVLEKFFWDDFCDNYLEIVKGRIYGKDSFAYKSHSSNNRFPDEEILFMQQSAQYTLHHIVINVIKLFAPFIPFNTERMFQVYFTSESKPLHACGSFLSVDEYFFDEVSIETSNIGLGLISEVRKYKSGKGLSLKAEISLIEANISIPEEIHFDLRCACNAINANITKTDVPLEKIRIEHLSS